MKTIKKIFNKFFGEIGKSVIAGNPISTPRFQSWIILAAILLQMATFASIEIFSFIVAIKTGVPHSISSESILIFGMVLSHQLALVFSRRKSQSIKNIKGDNDDNDDEIENNNEIENGKY